MKKIKLAFLTLSLSILLINCNSSKKGTEGYTSKKKISYTKDIKPIVENSCIPCHIPPEGRKKPLESYIHVKENIVAILERVQLPQDNRKFMPPVNKKPALTEAQIAVLLKWQQQNMPE